MSSDVKKVSSVIVFAPKTQEVKQYLFDRSNLPIEEEVKTKIESGELSRFVVDSTLKDEEINVGQRFVKGREKDVVRLSSNHMRAILDLVQSNGAQGVSNNFVLEPTGFVEGLSDEEQRIGNALKNVTDILRRVYGRRTGMTSWILYWFLRSYGFNKEPSQDDFGPIESDLKDPDFVKSFAKYYSLLQAQYEDDAKEFLQNTFGKDVKKQKLASLAANLINICQMIPKPILDIIPPVFCSLNILTPLLARFVFKKGPLHNILSVLRGVNPWIDEFGAGLMGVFKPEIESVQKSLKGETTLPERCNGIELVELTNLEGKEQYGLRKVVEKINSAFDRLLGRKSTLSSWIALLALKLIKFKDYHHFASQTIESPSFIPEFYSSLKNSEGKDSSDKEVKPQLADPKDKTDKTVASVVKYLVSTVKSMSDDFIDKAPKVFGRFYSLQYLFMPIVSALVGDKGFWGRLIGFIRDFNPILNDAFFELLATFREECIGVKNILEEDKNVDNLFPEIHRKGLDKVVENIQGFAKTVRGFGTWISSFMPKPKAA